MAILVASSPFTFPPKLPPISISISTNPSHLNPHHLRSLLSASSLSCHRFPLLNSQGIPDPVDIDKLRIALAHSFVVVSVFCSPKLFPSEEGNDGKRRLVGFGRAVSDRGLTASVHDVVVLPSLRRRGIGRRIVEKITRILWSKGIYDISALCSESERPFFKACGFGNDSLGSTTMLYTKTVSGYLEDEQMVTPAGRLLLFVPPLRETIYKQGN